MKCVVCRAKMAICGDHCLECRDSQLDRNAFRKTNFRAAITETGGRHLSYPGFGRPAILAFERMNRESDAKMGVWHHPDMYRSL